ncbi:MAG: gamma-glutamyl-gamma-aminobutyrate hydrolase family protein, partial [Deltaproteobacteria bacterium]
MSAPRIAISPNLMGPDETRRFYPNKHLFYGERSMAAAVLRAGGLPFVLPDLPPDDLRALLADCHGLLLSGGADVAPSTYGATPILGGRFPGDPERDALEIDLVRTALDRRLPLLGICRGHQVLNVAMGGTLLQDIATERPGSLTHRDQAKYDSLHHHVTIDPESRLA